MICTRLVAQYPAWMTSTMMFLRLGANARTALSSQEIVGFGLKTCGVVRASTRVFFSAAAWAMQESLISCPLASLTMAMPGGGTTCSCSRDEMLRKNIGIITLEINGKGAKG